MDYISQAEALAQRFGIVIPLEDQPSAFLRTVWAAMPKTDQRDQLVGLIADTEYWATNLKDKKGLPLPPQWMPSVSPSWTWASHIHRKEYGFEWAHERNNANYELPGLGGIYWNAVSRKHNVLRNIHRHARGGLDDLMYASALWADLDCDARGYTLEQGIEALLAMPLRPSVIIFSGGGLQAAHVLNEAWPVINYDAAQEFTAYSLAFYKPVFNASGLVHDEKVHNADRMVRLPGFINRKPSRNGAIARILYLDPDAAYSMDDIKRFAPLPEIIDQPSVYPVLRPDDLPMDTYQVSLAFCNHLIDEPQVIPPERHPVMILLAHTARNAGMEEELFGKIARPVHEHWYASEPQRWQELDKIIDHVWHKRAAGRPYGSWLVRVNQNADGTIQLERAPEEIQEQLRSRTIIIPYPLDEEVTSIEAIEPIIENAAPQGAVPDVAQPKPIEIPIDQIELRQQRPLDQVRGEQLILMRQYVDAKIKNLGTYMLVRTDPGAGKTHAAWQLAEEVAEEHFQSSKQAGLLDEPNYHGKVAFLDMFKHDERTWEVGLPEEVDRSKIFYFVARNGDVNSAGYCALSTQAELIARKNYDIQSTLCSGRCPHVDDCKIRWYLSQTSRAKRAEIIWARHHHGAVDELMQSRKLIIFDESPLQVIAGTLKLSLNDLSLPATMAAGATEFEKEVQLLYELIEALRFAVQQNTPFESGQYPQQQHVKLQGRWLLDRLIEGMADRSSDVIYLQTGADKLRTVLSLNEKIVDALGHPFLADLSLQAIEALPVKWLLDVWRILRYEYDTHYCAGATAWNSRLIPYGQSLIVMPMLPYEFTRDTKIVICDATADESLYGKAFADKQGRPREGYVYGDALEAKGHVTQFTGNDHTLSSFRRRPRRKLNDAPDPDLPASITTTDGQTIAFSPADFEDLNDNDAISRSKRLIAYLATKHQGSLLVVVNKETVERKLKRWAIEKKILPDPELQLKWFGGLRGKNDHQHLEAVLVIGTPRMQQMNLMINAQVWHWRDPYPIDSEAEIRIHPYSNYIDPSDSLPRGYKYKGYKDPRLNTLYLKHVMSELRQCYERVRPNASTTLKYIYLATGFPCADHIDVLLPWSRLEVNLSMDEEIKRQIASGIVNCAQCIRHVVKETGCSRPTAQTVYDQLESQIRANPRWNNVIHTLDPISKTPMMVFNNSKAPQSKVDRIIAWLHEDKTGQRLKLSSRDVARETGISLGSVMRAFRKVGG